MNRTAAFAVLSAVALSLLATGCAASREAPSQASPQVAAPADAEVKFVTPSPDYPLKTCVVTGEDLHEDGEPVAITYQGTEVQFCCPKCVAEFKKDPARYLAMVKAATPQK